MAIIRLTDQLGLNLDMQLADTSTLLKYAQQLPALRLDNLDLKKLGGLTLDQPALTSLGTGVSFQNPIGLGEGNPVLTVGAGAGASLHLIRDADDLPGHDDSIEQPADTCYVTFGVQATASAAVSAGSGMLEFGATPSSQVDVVTCSRFPLKTGVTLTEAISQTVASFVLPLRSSDLERLAVAQVAKVGVNGKLKLSGSVDLLAVTNPLASAQLPAPLPGVSVSAGSSATIGVTCAILTDYEIVARKLDSGAVRLGWYRKSGTEVTVSAQVSEGVSAGVGTTDLLSLLVGVISASPKVDLAELANAGVPAEQASAIQEAVKAATSRKVEVAVAAEFSAADSRAATFLYDIVPSALTDISRNAVDQALRGDLTQLHSAGLAGVTAVRSVWDNVRRRGLELDVNLLGILNYRSVTTLALEGRVLYEPATGTLVVTDRATAERIRSTQVNFGADSQKLRHVLAESFLITAAYRTAGLVQGASLQCRHMFFELQNSTSRADMARKLNTGVALSLLSLDEAKLPEGVTAFGRTLFSVGVDYDNDLVRHMFLDSNGSPLAREIYETMGRNAIQFVVQDGDEDAVRRRPAIDDDLWRKMKQTGQPGFGALFPGVPSPLVAAIAADFSAIQWWADAMQNTGQQLAAVGRWISQHPGTPANDPGFQKVRDDLAGYLRQVAADTREEFGEPWGLIAMNQLTGRRAGAKILITGPVFSKDKRRELAAATVEHAGPELRT